jgi:hypothetical protein
VRVHYGEGVAIHTGLKPCVGTREGDGEASVEERIGQPLSRESAKVSGADAVSGAEGNMDGRVSASARTKPGAVEDTGMCGRSLSGNREISWSTRTASRHWPASGRRGAVADDARL